ncbi:MAG: putative membrane-bound redox modulator Alx [Candidatus Omnitrophica bacterium]|nr:putative membrane-bound redox modulator Alx [Candidatus Omnitrophota bacterium]
MFDSGIWPWVFFNLFVLAMLALDLGVFHRKSHAVGMKEALGWSAFWIALALTFNAGLAVVQGKQVALEFLAGYLIEKSLSVDNIFVFVLIFSFFRIPAQYQHRVLFWGILGALLMRAGFIAGGITLLKTFHWMIYVFGGFLVITGIKMAFKHEAPALDKNPVVRLFKKFMPVTPTLEGQRFFVRKQGRTWATPLFLALLIVEVTDVIFAVDSIPAILAVTDDPFIVYTSNVFAILGLRSLYFALAGVVGLFRYLHYGLAAILVFVGSKMLISDVYKVPIGVSLGVIGALLAVSVLMSVWIKPKGEHA